MCDCDDYEDDEDEGMDPKSFRVLMICVAAVVVAIIAGCTITAAVAPHEWECVMNGPICATDK